MTILHMPGNISAYKKQIHEKIVEKISMSSLFHVSHWAKQGLDSYKSNLKVWYIRPEAPKLPTTLTHFYKKDIVFQSTATCFQEIHFDRNIKCTIFQSALKRFIMHTM